MSDRPKYQGVDGTWESGYGDEHITYTVYADDTSIATYQVHGDGALERMWSAGPVAMNTPIAVASKESALRQCEAAWNAMLDDPPEPIQDFFARINARTD